MGADAGSILGFATSCREPMNAAATAACAYRADIATPAKLNLRLRIVGRRPDGYHLLDSLVVPISLFDHLRVEVEPATRSSVAIECLPRPAVPDSTRNLAARAATLFLERSGISAGVRIRLLKRIPIGAGLGGGSSDAAAVLRVLHRMLDCGVPEAELARWALDLGADVPFFLYGRPAYMRGIGEIIEPAQVALRGPIVVAFPGIGLDTATVYRTYDGSLTSGEALSTIPPLTSRQESPHRNLVNDLEAAAFQVQPAVRDLRREMASLGAEGVLMTGSGSAVFGLWRKRDDARAAAQQLRAGGMWAQVVEILQQSPTFEVVNVSVGGRQVW